MIHKLRKRQGGFTRIELLIVVAIIGIIAALLIPNFLDALQKAKQKRTVADMRNTGTAAMSWLTDQLAASAAGATKIDLADYSASSVADWEGFLVSQYIQDVPDKDGWKTLYTYRRNTDVGESQIFAIQSAGRGGPDVSGEITSTAFDPTDYNQDIVWADGFFVRWPQKVTN